MQLKEAYNRGDVAWKEVLAARDHAVWEAGRNLVAWMERTGRSPLDWGEGHIFCYLSYEADGRTEREESLKIKNSEAVMAFEAKFYKAIRF